MGPVLNAESVIVERPAAGELVRLLLVAPDGTRMAAPLDERSAREIANHLLVLDRSRLIGGFDPVRLPS